MKKLFLSSSFADVANLLKNFEKDLTGKTVTFIPTASIVEEVAFYVDEGRKALESLGLIVDVLELSTATSGEIKSKIEDNDFIYLTGGNTFFLLQELKRTGADRIIANEVNKGKLYIGESAGAMVTSPNIAYGREMDRPEKAPQLMGLDAMNLVAFHTVPHYSNMPFTQSTKSIMKRYASDLNLLAITNHEAILVENNDVRIEEA